MRRPSRPLSERRPSRAQISAEQLASLSHEFRTPLNGVLGMARLLEGTKLTAEQKAYVSALHDSGARSLITQSAANPDAFARSSTTGPPSPA